MSNDAASTALPPVSPLLSVPGAVVGTSAAEPGVAAHYGEPFREQRSLAAGTAIVDLSGRGVVTVTGPDRLTWLDSLTSQALARLAPGDSAETLLLDPTGRIEHLIRVVDDGETAWLLLDRDETAGLAAWLDRMRFMLRVEIADRTADFATLATLGEGPATALALELAGESGISWLDPWAQVQPGGWQYATVPAHPASGWSARETIVPRGALEQLAARARAAGVALAGADALEALRIAAWRPRHATEVDDRSIPHELDLLRSSVHLAKGCYRGQETVAKVHNLGHPPRRMVALQLDGSGSELPRPGAPVRVGEDAVGALTSVALHYEEGPIALAVVKRTTPVDAQLLVDGADGPVAASQEVIVPPEAGATANVPRLPRLGRRTSA